MPDTYATPRLADRLTAAERRRFVGRRAELELFRSILVDETPVAVLHVHGPGGVGKSALLREFARIATQQDRRVVLLDARSIDPSPLGFEMALRDNLRVADASTPLDWFAQSPNSVILVDTYELLSSLDAWLRGTFLPQLPERMLMVTAGRVPPDTAWTTDLGWGELVRVISLRNLRPEESRAYLSARDVVEEQHGPVLEFTHGHPLALSLIADALGRRGAATPFRADAAPDVVRVLLESFLAEIPSPRHRMALQLCAQMRCTTEPLIRDVIGADDARELFEWLRGLTFVEEGGEGLFPHDLAREVLNADYRWRDPESFCDMHVRAERYARRRVQETTGRARQRAFFDKLFMLRTSSIGRLFVDWASLGTAFADVATEREHAAILAMVRRHEGDESARIAEYWLRRQPDAFQVLHDAVGEPLGFVAVLTLRDPSAEDLAIDPALRAAWTFLRAHGPLRADEEIRYNRFFMERDVYQVPSPLTNLLAMTVSVEALTCPRLAATLMGASENDFFEAMASHVGFDRARAADYAVGGRAYAAFIHDWRVEPVDLWGDRLSARSATAESSPATERAPVTPLLVLSEPEFQAAVRAALRDWTRLELLAANSLVRSRVVTERSKSEPAAALRSLVREAVESLRSQPRDEKFYRALIYTFIQPAPTQERAAERLGLPFTTYRYQLARGTDRVIEWLWHRELYGERGVAASSAGDIRSER